ncbi:hypothetical protein E5343_07110 [Rodentibacter caecimuris]|nr:hypothetical protein [Pasteurella caecimuris]TGY49358.1 hypothetical protein E5343_07110 [Pasteurella caecimuris]
MQNQTDPLGLDTYMCTRGLNQPSGTWSPPIFNHTYLCTGDANNPSSMFCSSTTQKKASNPLELLVPRESRPTNAHEDSFQFLIVK